MQRIDLSYLNANKLATHSYMDTDRCQVHESKNSIHISKIILYSSTLSPTGQWGQPTESSDAICRRLHNRRGTLNIKHTDVMTLQKQACCFAERDIPLTVHILSCMNNLEKWSRVKSCQGLIIPIYTAKSLWAQVWRTPSSSPWVICWLDLSFFFFQY